MAEFTANGSNGRHKFIFSYQERANSVSSSNNTSVVEWSLKLAPISTGYDWIGYNSLTYSINVNGDIRQGYLPSSYDGSSTVTIREGATTVTHNDDGSKKISVAISVSASGAYYLPGTASGSGTLTLTKIARKSAPTTSVASANAGTTVTINTNRASSSFTHTISYKLGSQSGTLATKTTNASISWSIPLAILHGMPSSSTGTCTITCETFNGSTSLGSNTCNLSITVPSSAYPTASIDSITEGNSYVSAKGASITIQSLSKKSIKTTFSAQYGATIRSATLNNNGNTVSVGTTGGTTSSMSGLTSGTYTLTVIDSRGCSTQKTVTQTFYSYNLPAITTFTVIRTTQTGNTSTMNLRGTYSEPTTSGGSTLANAITAIVKRTDQSGIQYTPTYSGTKWSTSDTYTDISHSAGYAYTASVSDSYGNTATASFNLSASTPIFFLGKTLARVGGTLYTNALDVVNNSLTLNGKSFLNRTYPVGSIYMSTSSTNPSSLFGGTWQALSGRFLVGVDGSTYTAGATGGYATYKLEEDQLPSHNHGIRVQWHDDAQTKGALSVTSTSSSHLAIDQGGNTGNGKGKNLAIDNQPPYLAVYMWKRTA